MSVNKDQAHVLVIPEDDANRQLANGFQLGIDSARYRRMQILPVAGGWLKVVAQFESEYRDDMCRLPARHLVLLIDFDGQQDRLELIQQLIPAEIAERVFVLGVRTQPEALKRAGLGGYEKVGQALANDCREGVDTTWSHDLLRHNRPEIERLNRSVRAILF